MASPDTAAVRVGVLPDAEPHRGLDAKDPRPKSERVARRPVRGATAAKLQEHDLRAALREVPHLNITSDTTGEEADAAVRNVAKIGNLTLGVMSYTGLTPWERHPDGDELLLALDGELEVTTLTDDGPVTRKLRAGEAFVCPQGLWHRQFAEKSVSMLYGTPIDTSEISMADDPRGEKAERSAHPPRGPAQAADARAASCRSCISRARRSAVEFYKSVFGATVLMRDEEPSGIVSHAMLKMGETTVMLSDPTSADVKQNDVHHLSRIATFVRRLAGASVHLCRGRRRRCASARSRPARRLSTKSRTATGATGAAESRIRTVTSGLSGRR